MELGERVAAARDHAGLTQADLAKRAGVTQQTIQKLEAGRAKRSGALAEICLETGVSLRWLARGQGQMIEAQSQLARPDPVILANAVKTLQFLAQMQASDTDVVFDAPAILAAYDYLSREPAQVAFDREAASKRMAAWLRGRENDDNVGRGEVVGSS